MIIVNLALKLFEEVRSPIVGFRFTKHFWKRYTERFKTDLRPIESLMNRIDKELPMLIFDAAIQHRYKQVLFEHNGAVISLVLLVGDYPEMIATTIYAKNTSSG